MPSKKDRWEYRGYWLSKRPNSPQWCRTWFDAEAKQTRRASLRTEDLQEAKDRLIEYVNQHNSIDKHEADQILLGTVFQRYYLQHAIHLPTKASRDAAYIGLQKATNIVGQLTVAEFRVAKQYEFVRELEKLGHKPGYIKRIYTSVRAALNWSYKMKKLTGYRPPSRCQTAQPGKWWRPRRSLRRYGMPSSPHIFECFSSWP